MKLPRDYYLNPDVVFLAKDLLGKILVSYLDGKLTAGRITETEAYCGRGDRACHAHLGRFTHRTAAMYELGGHTYVYLCYGIHALLNVVTHQKGFADAVLIRSMEPLLGIDLMMHRRNLKKPGKKLSSGPGNLTRAMGIDTKHNGMDLTGNSLWIESDRFTIKDEELGISPRIGVDYAGTDAMLPWRFYIRNHPFVSGKPID